MIRVLVMVLTLLSDAALAVEPDEVLSDPRLEERARDISKGLRCPVCQNESIDESNANIAKDLRLLVRDRLTQGDSDEEVVGFIVERYGEYVLLQPTVTGANWLLYAAGPLMLLFAAGMGVVYLRGRSTAAAPQDQALTEAETARLQEIMRD
ncbi:cytochrome c-type biogenesis protein [uncultured Roseobacter sp.]|uniref:cytochrome c-type biogenesis protein n=1 Tax=uncultured Roseobacter sp. TaxID=114847 RepID=UPI00262D4859|nr:cytochrome c-type biogenesis protein [uncultured Roseobacter sp.]